MPNQKGSNAERKLCDELWQLGFATLRAPGSGSIQRPSPDVIAIGDRGSYAIEVKSESDGTAHFASDEIEALTEWALRASAKPVVAVKPDLRSHDHWYIQLVRNLHVTNSGYSLRQQDHPNCYSIDGFFGERG